MRIVHPWTRATAADQTTAAVCMTFDEVTETDRLIRVETPIAAGAELAGAAGGENKDMSLLIPRDRETVLTESGVHIRLVGLKHPLELGRTYNLALGFEHGGFVNTKLTVDYTQAVPAFAKPFKLSR